MFDLPRNRLQRLDNARKREIDSAAERRDLAQRSQQRQQARMTPANPSKLRLTDVSRPVSVPGRQQLDEATASKVITDRLTELNTTQDTRKPEVQQEILELTALLEGGQPEEYSQGEANFPGIAGKIPGVRTPAELAATVGTAGIGTTGVPLARAGQAIGGVAAGSLGALAGRKGAEEVGLPPAVGEVVGGLAGGTAGFVAGGRAGQRAATNLAERTQTAGGVKGLLAEETGAIKLGGEEPPVRPPETEIPQPAPEQPRFARTSQLKSVAEIADDAKRSTQNWLGATTRTAGTLPPVRSVAHSINPSAFILDPPESLIAEIGKEQAVDLQANLLAHTRKIDNGGSIVTSVEDGLRQAARRVGFGTNDGMLTNKLGLSAPVGDVFENPGRYADVLTPGQKKLIDDVAEVLEDMNAAEKAAGVKKGEIFSDEGRYFPRQVAEVRGAENLRAAVRRATGATQGFQRGRFYETMLEGIDNNVRYEDDIAALVGTRLRAGVKAIADKEVGELLKPLGRTLPPETQVGELGTTVPAIGGRVFPRETAQTILKTLDPSDSAAISGLNVVNGFLRPLRATGDLSFTLLQNLVQLFRNPVAFFKTFGYGVDSLLLDGRMYGRYVESNTPFIERFTRSGGVWSGSEFTFENVRRGKLLSQTLGRATSRFDNAFNNASNVAALENFKAMVGVGDSLGTRGFRRAAQAAFGNVTGQTSDEIAASVATKMTGKLSSQSLGLSPVQRSVEGVLAFAPRFYRATFGMLGDAIQGGMRGAEARRALLGLVAGGVATYVGAARALNQKPNLDPTDVRFLSLKVGDNYVGFGGPLHGLTRMIAQAAEDPSSLGKLDVQKNPALRWARGRVSPVLAIAIDLADKENYIGQPLETPEQLAGYAGKQLLPFTGSTLVEEGPEAAAVQFPGGRAFPEEAAVLTDFYNIPQYEGLDPKIQREITGPDGFIDRAREARRAAIQGGIPQKQVEATPFEHTLRELGVREGRDKEFIEWAITLSKEKPRTESLNEDWLRFIIANEHQLRQDVPWIFSQWMEEFLRLNRAKAVGQ